MNSLPETYWAIATVVSVIALIAQTVRLSDRDYQLRSSEEMRSDAVRHATVCREELLKLKVTHRNLKSRMESLIDEAD